MMSESNHIGDTVRILRPPPRVFTDVLGRNIWMGEVAPCELELADACHIDVEDSTRDNVWSR